jgi:uroporphyrinogen decarboxylase
LNGTTIRENLNNSALQALTIKTLHHRFDFDIVFPMMDLTVESEALGAEVDWDTDEMPTVRGILVADLAGARAINVPEVGDGNRLDVYVETCALLRKAFPEKIVWGYVLGPFSIAGRLMGMTEIAIATKLEPEVVHAVLEKANALLYKYIDALLATGIDGVMILEPASSLLRAEDADEFSNSYMQSLVARIKAAGKTPALHNCGNIDHMVENLCATGIEALHINHVSDMRGAYDRIPSDVVLMGNLDPSSVLLQGTPERVREESCKLQELMNDCERFVLSSGCDVAPGTSLENVQALVESVDECEATCAA